jgi:diaminohydroxyphosphoribosylaminopyrimidine deaminase/5-amino-6-(5-phosphoribosylamino)uracil reductase
MSQALHLARRGAGKVSPNPMVGAVIVRGGEIIGRGYHRYFGGKHAEIEAMEDAGGKVEGATMYVTLEPCCCLDALLNHRIGRVVIGVEDPNPEVRGKSIEALRGSGVETEVGVLEGECYDLNRPYFKYMKTGFPFVTVKFAQTLDGRIASASGDSRWISSEPSLELAHRLRSLHDSVMVGIGTILADNPSLTVRRVRGRSPVRLVLDGKLRIPLGAEVLKGQNVSPTMVITTPRAGKKKLSSLKDKGIEVLTIRENETGEVDLKGLLFYLGRRNISSILVEGGSEVITSFFREGLVDRVVAIIAPKVMGRGVEAVGDLGIGDVNHTLKLSFMKTYRRGEDLVIEAFVQNPIHLPRPEV